MMRRPPSSTLSLHDALPILARAAPPRHGFDARAGTLLPLRHLDALGAARSFVGARSEEHTSELQSLRHLVCRLLLEKKKTRYVTCRNRHAYKSTVSTVFRDT